ncbi:MAG: chromosome segregation protein SMC [archaeon]|nr:chromosome segregation protein SMC [archaeon]
MTKINHLKIQGFKSFAHKTEIPFDNKFNCVLGPNGSGKSNIGDALCFVLGRLSAKSMRAEKAANLIFNGGKNKKPASSGTVEIGFDNSKGIFPLKDKEVVVSRTITKTGISIYRVNNEKKTRTEIIDLLSHAKINPDGYNIILQGDITRFVTMSSLDRRKIIEEISDVSLYEEKKHKALLELQKVEEKLNNAEIILKERKTYLKELKSDRDQALKFKELRDRVDSNKATFVHLQMKEKQEIKDKLDAEVGKHKEKLDDAEKKIEELRQKITEHKNEISKINNEIEQKGEKEQIKVHREIEESKVEIAKNKTRVSTLKDEIGKIKQRKDQFTEELKELGEKLSNYSQKGKELQQTILRKQKELEAVEKSIADFKKKNKIESSQEMEQEIDEKDKIIEQKQEDVQKSRQKQQELLREKDKLEYQLETIDERIRKVREVERENKDQLKQLQSIKDNFKTATLKLNKCLNEDSGFASQLANARRNLSEAQEEHAKINAKAMSIQAQISGNQAVKGIIDNKKKIGGIFGTVAELGQVQKKYSTALETAASGKLQHIVVDSDKTASDCINFLQKNKLGSASFIPLNKIQSRDISEEDKKFSKQNGVQNFAINLVSFQPQFKKAFSYVFGNTLIVDDIEVARKVGVGKIRMATLDGNAVESSGVMRGGFMGRRSGGGFRERDSLEELEKIEGQLSQLQGVIKNIEVKRETNLQEINSLRNLKSELEGDIIKLEKTLHLETGDLEATSNLKKELQENLKIINDELSTVQKDLTITNRDLTNFKSSKQILRTQISQLRDPRLLAQLSAFEESRQKLREDILRSESDMKNSNTQSEQLVAPERNKIQEILKQHEKEEVQFKEEIIKLTETIVNQDKELVQREKASTEFYTKYRQLFANREVFSGKISKSENEIESLREKSRSNEQQINLISLKNAEAKARLAGLEEEFSRFKDVPLLKNKSVDELRQEISKFEVMLGQMSAVNMKALEVYEEVETEYNKLTEKRESLVREQTDVHTLMNEIETRKTDHFMKTFDKANQHFTKVFSSLFKKGNAFLQLDNPKNPFDDGLSIKVKISGNRYMDLKSLSGGEKTLTALSFIFAIQEYQPASFYILDEIDAALDKHNAETLAKLIRSYSEQAQYIVISHNDSLISEADTLYGVSMKDGVSKVTSLRI